jgi:phage terminase large subunit-like protein
MRDNLDVYKLVLWPRDHGKSRYAAFYVAWTLVRDPAATIIYCSCTATKADDMLQFLLNQVFDTAVFRRYFPNMFNKMLSQRTKWTNSAMTCDHPIRKERGVVDPTIVTAGIGTKITGKHCDLIVFDDVVVLENTVLEGEEGRKRVAQWISMVASVAATEADRLVVGTRYHPKDAYDTMINLDYETFDEQGNVIESKPMYAVSQADVEVDGQFLWPRHQNKDGRWFGFNKTILSKKKAEYTANGEVTQFYAQYYNDPNDRTTAPISRDMFRYYEEDALHFDGGFWYIDDKPLYLYAAVDLASSIRKTSDYTAITIGGIDDDGNRYLLSADRWKTDRTSITLDKLETAYQKYSFRAMRIEAIGGFKLVANDIKLGLEQRGIRIPIELYTPPPQAAKIVRIHGVLEPMYQAGSVFHYRGGVVEALEEELVSMHPSHDDLKDAWAATLDPQFMKKPVNNQVRNNRKNVIQFNSRFGGYQGRRR